MPRRGGHQPRVARRRGACARRQSGRARLGRDRVRRRRRSPYQRGIARDRSPGSHTGRPARRRCSNRSRTRYTIHRPARCCRRTRRFRRSECRTPRWGSGSCRCSCRRRCSRPCTRWRWSSRRRQRTCSRQRTQACMQCLPGTSARRAARHVDHARVGGARSHPPRCMRSGKSARRSAHRDACRPDGRRPTAHRRGPRWPPGGSCRRRTTTLRSPAAACRDRIIVRCSATARAIVDHVARVGDGDAVLALPSGRVFQRSDRRQTVF